jgi:uncharacterized protein (TIGR02172 family)
MCEAQGERIAEGATAEILAWGDGLVLKLYRDGYPQDEAEREAERVRAAVAAGVATPNALETIRVEGRAGVVFERVDGQTMLERLMAHPEQAAEMARLLAEEHVALHARQGAALPSLKEHLAHKISGADRLTGDLKARARHVLAKLPDGDALCHGDFHPANILLTERGPVVVDWVEAVSGHPLADVARTRVLICLISLPPTLSEVEREQIEGLRRWFWETYQDRYRALRPFSDADLAAWIGPVAAGRLSEGGIGGDEAIALIEAVESNLALG